MNIVVKLRVADIWSPVEHFVTGYKNQHDAHLMLRFKFGLKALTLGFWYCNLSVYILYLYLETAAPLFELSI